METALWGSATFPRVLAILLEEPTRERRFAELVEGSGADRESVHRALRRGMGAGLVKRRQVGNQFLYQADLRSQLHREMRVLMAKTYGVHRLLAETLAQAGAPLVEQAFTFGSFAEGHVRPESDIDLFVIGTIGRIALAELLRSTQSLVGRTINAIAYPRQQVEQRLRTGDAFFLEVWAQPKIMVVGNEDDLPAPTEAIAKWR